MTFLPSLKSNSAALDGDGLPVRIVAIADIHGMAPLFDRLIAATCDIDRFSDAAFYILGDMVDRGPDSRGTIDRVRALMDRRSGSRYFAGNHDLWFLAFLKNEMDEAELTNWLSQGGAETLKSYGVADNDTDEAGRERLLLTAPDLCDWLEAAEPIALVGDFAFVHAGVDPQVPLDRQSKRDCAWIRAPFMRHEGRLSHVVVHGHTPQKGRRPTVTENRISIDTGAVFGGKLTAALIDREAGTLDFLSADGNRVTTNQPTLLDRGFGTIRDQYPSGR